MPRTRGVPYIVWILAIVITIIIGVYSIHYVLIKMKSEEVETLKTNLLLIQSKVKLIYDDYQMDKKDENLKGIKMQSNTENELVKEVLEKKLIDENEENYEWFYILNKDMMDELGIKEFVKEDNYIIVNYVSKEVVLEKPYIDENGKEYYRLTQLKEI